MNHHLGSLDLHISLSKHPYTVWLLSWSHHYNSDLLFGAFWDIYQFPGWNSWETLKVTTTAKRVTPRRCNLILISSSILTVKVLSSSSSGGVLRWRASILEVHFLLYRRNNRLRIFLFIFFFFQGEAKEERRRGLKRKRSIWNFISRLGRPF